MACRLMPANYHAFLSQLLIGWLALLSLAVVGYLMRLKLAEMRKNRRMAERGERFGLIQNITATGKPVVKRSSLSSQPAASVPASVSSMDKGVKRWTIPPKTGGVSYQWN